MEATERLSLPMLVPGQAQKEVFHNEALLLLDAMVACSVEEFERDEPPGSPLAGACYVVSATPGGEWSQFPDHIAFFGSAGWRYVPPVEGMTALVKTTGTTAVYRSAGWELGAVRGSRMLVDDVQVVGPQASAISGPVGGSIVDVEARTTLEQILSALRSHGLIAAE